MSLGFQFCVALTQNSPPVQSEYSEVLHVVAIHRLVDGLRHDDQAVFVCEAVHRRVVVVGDALRHGAAQIEQKPLGCAGALDHDACHAGQVFRHLVATPGAELLRKHRRPTLRSAFPAVDVEDLDDVLAIRDTLQHLAEPAIEYDAGGIRAVLVALQAAAGGGHQGHVAKPHDFPFPGRRRPALDGAVVSQLAGQIHDAVQRHAGGRRNLLVCDEPAATPRQVVLGGEEVNRGSGRQDDAGKSERFDHVLEVGVALARPRAHALVVALRLNRVVDQPEKARRGLGHGVGQRGGNVALPAVEHRFALADLAEVRAVIAGLHFQAVCRAIGVRGRLRASATGSTGCGSAWIHRDSAERERPIKGELYVAGLVSGDDTFVVGRVRGLGEVGDGQRGGDGGFARDAGFTPVAGDWECEDRLIPIVGAPERRQYPDLRVHHHPLPRLGRQRVALHLFRGRRAAAPWPTTL